jgi:hypothetical protein
MFTRFKLMLKIFTLHVRGGNWSRRIGNARSEINFKLWLHWTTIKRVHSDFIDCLQQQLTIIKPTVVSRKQKYLRYNLISNINYFNVY